MAHIRRKFIDLMKAHHSPVATEALQRIAAGYLIEKEIEGRSAEERRAVRTGRPLLYHIQAIAPSRATVTRGS
jgi:transposase